MAASNSSAAPLTLPLAQRRIGQQFASISLGRTISNNHALLQRDDGSGRNFYQDTRITTPANYTPITTPANCSTAWRTEVCPAAPVPRREPTAMQAQNATDLRPTTLGFQAWGPSPMSGASSMPSSGASSRSAPTTYPHLVAPSSFGSWPPAPPVMNGTVGFMTPLNGEHAAFHLQAACLAPTRDRCDSSLGSRSSSQLSTPASTQMVWLPTQLWPGSAAGTPMHGVDSVSSANSSARCFHRPPGVSGSDTSRSNVSMRPNSPLNTAFIATPSAQGGLPVHMFGDLTPFSDLSPISGQTDASGARTSRSTRSRGFPMLEQVVETKDSPDGGDDPMVVDPFMLSEMAQRGGGDGYEPTPEKRAVVPQASPEKEQSGKHSLRAMPKLRLTSGLTGK